MIDFIVQCLAISLSIALGVVFIYGCCKGINRLFEGRTPCTNIKVRNFVRDGTLVDIRLSDGHTLLDQTFVGFADFGTQKVPFEFQTWLVLENSNGRSFLKPQTVRAILEKNNRHEA